MTYRKVVSIHGVPRSGTSWLGQIFNKHSNVVYKFQPLFSYHFKDRLSINSTPSAIKTFLDDLYAINDDDFIAGRWPKPADDPIPGITFYKREVPEIMVIKEVRYHHLIELLINSLPEIKIVGIIRNPCAVINSWLQSPKEFHKEWDRMAEWFHAPSKNQGKIEEYFGYSKWKELALAFLDFEQRYPEKIFLVQYEQLVTKPVKTMEKAFSFCGLNMEDQVLNFIKESQNLHIDDPYAVFKSPSVKDKWRQTLDQRIIDTISSDLQGTKLDRFLA